MIYLGTSLLQNHYSMYKLSKIIIFIWVFSCQWLFAQNIQQDLHQMYKAYKNLNTFSSDIKIYIQEAENESYNLFQEGKVRKRGQDFFVQLGNVVHLQNQHGKLTINHEHQQIGYIEYTEADAKETEIVQTFEDLLKQQDITKFKFVGIENGQKHYHLTQKNKMIEQIELYINKETFLLEQLEYNYNEVLMNGYQKVRILYERNTLQPIFKKNQFSENTYLKKRNGIISLHPAYAKYSLTTFKNEPENEK